MKKRSFFERLTGSIKLSDEETEELESNSNQKISKIPSKGSVNLKVEGLDHEEDIEEQNEEEAELAVDVYQTNNDIIVQTMVAGVEPQNLTITITREVVTIKGKREEGKLVAKDNYFTKELYWGSFSRTIDLPQEVEPEEAEATEKHGLLMIRLPKINKDKKTNLKVKSI